MNYLNSLIDNTNQLFRLYEIFRVENKNDLLDPFTVIVNLALLSYKESGTKLCIMNKSISIHDNITLQSVIRTIGYQKKDDLKLLYEPIVQACKYFILSDQFNELIPIFKCVLQGIDKLKLTYARFDDVKQILNVYNNLILKSLDNSLKCKIFLDNVIELSKSQSLINDDTITIKQHFYDKLNQLWNTSRRTIISNLFNELMKDDGKDKTFIFKSIDSLLQDVKLDTTSIIKVFTK